MGALRHEMCIRDRYKDTDENGKTNISFTPCYNSSQLFTNAEEELLEEYLLKSSKLNSGLT